MHFEYTKLSGLRFTAAPSPRDEGFEQCALFGLGIGHFKDGLRDGPEQIILAQAVLLDVGGQFLCVAGLPQPHEPVQHVNQRKTAGWMRLAQVVALALVEGKQSNVAAAPTP